MANIAFEPSEDRVLIEPAQAEEKTASGIYIPDTAKEKPQHGTIVAVGEGKKDAPMKFNVGDVVMYSKYGGVEIPLDGKEYLIMKCSDIYGTLKK